MPDYPHGLLAKPTATALSEICETLVGTAHAAWAQLDDPKAPEALHDLRVTIRRLRSVLRAFRPQLVGTVPKKLRRQLRDLQRVTNPARDAEVQMAWIAGRRSECTRGQWTGARWLLRRLREIRDEGYEASASAVASKFPRLERRLRKRLEEATVWDEEGASGPTFAAVCGDLVREHRAVLEEGLASITGSTKEAEVHATRISAKRLRYLLELVEPDVEPARQAVNELKQLQDVLGDLHDAQVADEELAEASETAAAEHARRLHELEARDPDNKRARRAALRKNAVPGLLALARMRQEERERLFARFRQQWGNGRHAQLREAISGTLAELDPYRRRADLEIERKYLLSALPSASEQARVVDVDQGWLPGTQLVERIRRVREGQEESYFRTVKLGSGLVRTEIEEEATRAVFEQLWPLTEGRRVRKRRYYVTDGELTWELDEFLDRDLVLAEVELPSADTVARPPEWLQPCILREVTGEPEYLNVNLAS